MPKMKTHRGAAKRFRVTKNGKLKVSKSNRRHILNKKTTKRKRGLRKNNYVSDAMEQNIRELMPYK